MAVFCLPFHIHSLYQCKPVFLCWCTWPLPKILFNCCILFFFSPHTIMKNYEHTYLVWLAHHFIPRRDIQSTQSALKSLLDEWMTDWVERPRFVSESKYKVRVTIYPSLSRTVFVSTCCSRFNYLSIMNSIIFNILIIYIYSLAYYLLSFLEENIRLC